LLKGSNYDQVAINQRYKCPNCGQSLFNGEEVETHDIILVEDGGLDDTENLIHLPVRIINKKIHNPSLRLEVRIKPCGW